MYTNNLEQLISFLYFIATGIILSIIFDIFRILRRTFKTSDIITNIEDVLFGIFTGITILFSIFFFNNGQLRFYIFIGIIIGIVFYMLFFSKYFININMIIINSIKKFIVLLIKPIKIIYKFLKNIFFRPISFIIINIRKIGEKNVVKIKKIFKTKIKHKKITNEEGF